MKLQLVGIAAIFIFIVAYILYLLLASRGNAEGQAKNYLLYIAMIVLFFIIYLTSQVM